MATPVAVTACARAGVADPHHQHLRAHRPKPVQLFQVVLQLADQVVLDVEHAVAHLADRVLVLADKWLAWVEQDDEP